MKNASLAGFFKSILRMVTPGGPTFRSVLRVWWLLPAIVFTFLSAPAAERGAGAGNPYEKWAKGPPSDRGFFPLAVWLQAPSNAERYRKAGFNTYVGLWRGPTEEQLATLEKAGMRLICHQNEVGMRDAATAATFTLGEINGERVVDVLGEDRMIAARNGSFTDRFGPWDAHFYRLAHGNGIAR